LKKQTINIVTLGCSKNKVDSEHLTALLPGNYFSIYHDLPEETDIVIINTCGFIGDAKEESVETILSYAESRKVGKLKKLVVMGCLSQRYKSELEEEIHEVDAFFGVNDLQAIAGFLNPKSSNLESETMYHYKRILSTPSHYAYLKVSEGCDRQCSFCAIPLIRGKHRSVSEEKLMEEAEGLARQGVKEIILIAQDLTFYGIDLYGERRIAQLVQKLSTIEEIEWIRLQYTYPTGFPIDLLNIIDQNPKVCRYLDLPLQHISSHILKSMKRGLNKNQTLDLIRMAREKIPGLAFRTTLITGYPGETEADFAELVHFVESQRFERLGVFPYSLEEGTSAFKLHDSVPDEIKIKRMEQIMEIQQSISLSLNQEKIGQTMRVLIDRIENDLYVGRTEFDSPEVDNEVLIPITTQSLQIGEFYNILITGAGDFDLTGIPV
jgi:ribosomal protein S12 methylthiotransferase